MMNFTPVTNTTTLAVAPTTPAATISTAQQVNKTYQNVASHYVDIGTRIAQALAAQPGMVQSLNAALTAFQLNNAHIKGMADLAICEASTVRLSEVIIDTTLQRDLSLAWVSELLKRFQAVNVRPVCVYRDTLLASASDVTCWDGQHTVVMLYLIAKHVLKLDPKDVRIPAAVWSNTKKDQMRSAFIKLNSDEGTKALSPVEKHRQAVLAVRVDNSKDPTWIRHEAIQTAMEKNNMFPCEEGGALSTHHGAVSNMSEILLTVKGVFDLEDWSNFCLFFNTVCGSNRAVDSSEMWQWMYYLRLARSQGILVDNNYITALAAHITALFGGNYTGKKLLEKGKEAYLEWYRANMPHLGGSTVGHSWHGSKQKDLHTQYLCKLLAANKPTFQVPSVGGNMYWKVANHNLTKAYCTQP